jgi:hypothetical protein
VIVGTIVVALIGGAATVISALVYRKVGQVHVLVNSRLDTALEEINDLKSERGIARQAAATSAERMATAANGLEALGLAGPPAPWRGQVDREAGQADELEGLGGEEHPFRDAGEPEDQGDDEGDDGCDSEHGGTS